MVETPPVLRHLRPGGIHLVGPGQAPHEVHRLQQKVGHRPGPGSTPPELDPFDARGEDPKRFLGHRLHRVVDQGDHRGLVCAQVQSDKPAGAKLR
jgi:hypothetical protein